MDANLALTDFLRALRDRDIEVADEVSRALIGWIAGGGFIPDGVQIALDAIEAEDSN